MLYTTFITIHNAQTKRCCSISDVPMNKTTESLAATASLPTVVNVTIFIGKMMGFHVEGSLNHKVS
jgi:hypothetical protein